MPASRGRAIQPSSSRRSRSIRRASARPWTCAGRSSRHSTSMRCIQRVRPGGGQALDRVIQKLPRGRRLGRSQRTVDRLQLRRRLHRSRAGQQAQRGPRPRCARPAPRVHNVRMACASCMSLARCAAAFRSRRCRKRRFQLGAADTSVAGDEAGGVIPGLQHDLVAASGDVVLDEADVPTADGGRAGGGLRRRRRGRRRNRPGGRRSGSGGSRSSCDSPLGRDLSWQVAGGR